MPERQGSALHTARQVLIPLPSGKRYSQSVSFSSLEEIKDSKNPISRAGKACERRGSALHIARQVLIPLPQA